MRIIDLHVHAGPSVMPRAVDAAEMLQEAQQAGYSAIVIKDHYAPTMMSAEICEKHLGDGKCKVFGGIALNNSVGGINLKAVDAACALGAKLVWMPTVSSLRHKIMHSGRGLAFPSSKGMTVAENIIMYLNEDGSLNLNPNSLTVLKDCYVEENLADAKAYDSFQFVRQGFFCVDAKDSTPEHLVFNRIVSLKSSFKLPSNN